MSTRLADTNGSLAEALESSEVVRRRILEPPNQVLTRWVNDKLYWARSVELLKGKSSGAVWVGKTPFRDQISFQLCDETPVSLLSIP